MPFLVSVRDDNCKRKTMSSVRYYNFQELLIFARLWLLCRATGTSILTHDVLSKKIMILKKNQKNAIFPRIFEASLIKSSVPLTTSVISLSDNAVTTAVRNIQRGIDDTVEYGKIVENVARTLISIDRLLIKREALSQNIVDLRNFVQDRLEISM